MTKAAAKTEVKKVSVQEQTETKKKEVESLRIEIETKINSEPSKRKVKVHSFLFRVGAMPDNEDMVDFSVGFLTDPPFQVRKMALDMSIRSMTDAGQIVLESCIIKEHSDIRIWGEDSEEDYPKIRLGAIMKSQELVTYNEDTLKKK